ncbi:hypothetical protein MASR2M54_07600 [Aliarcobacter cryaerophilus]
MELFHLLLGLNTKIGSTYSAKDLNAEKSDRYEIGYKYDKRDTFLNDDYITFDANVFLKQNLMIL